MTVFCEDRIDPAIAALLQRAANYAASKDFDEAFQAYCQAVAFDSGQSARKAFVDHLMRRRQIEPAAKQVELLLHYAQTLGDLALLGFAYARLAEISRLRSDFHQAARYEQLAISAFQRGESQQQYDFRDTSNLSGRASDALQQGDLDLAADLFQRALQSDSQSLTTGQPAEIWNKLGTTVNLRGDRRFALSCFWQSYRLSKKSDDLHGQGAALMNLADFCWQSGHRRISFRCLRRAISTFERSGSQEQLRQAHQMLHNAMQVAEVNWRDPLLN